VVRPIVDGVVANVLRPWRRQAEIEQTIVEAVRRLPYALRGISEPTAWERRAVALAVEAVDRLGEGATVHQVEAAAEKAVDRTVAEFHAHRSAEADALECERLLTWLPLELRDFTEEGRELALQAVKSAWAALPVGMPRERLVQARDAALAPFRKVVAERRKTLTAPSTHRS
jgi:hypothetical protein